MITFHLVALLTTNYYYYLLLPLLLLDATITIIIMIILHYFILFHYYYWYYYYVDHLYRYHHYHRRWSMIVIIFIVIIIIPIVHTRRFNYVIDVIIYWHVAVDWERSSAVTAAMTFQYRETDRITSVLHRNKKELTDVERTCLCLRLSSCNTGTLFNTPPCCAMDTRWRLVVRSYI